MSAVRATPPPPPVDRDSAPWWEALARHELVLQRCAGCGTWRFPPRAICNRCSSFEWSWEPVSGRGTVASWVVNHHGFSDAFGSPYTVVLVRLDEQDDVLVLGAWSGAADGTDVQMGLPVAVGFDDVPARDDAPAFTRLQWRPASAGPG